MNAPITLSSKGQIVIPKVVRDALGWPEGQKLVVTKSGGKAIVAPVEPPRKRISYEEFRRRVPKYAGPSVSIEDMRIDFDRLWGARADEQ